MRERSIVWFTPGTIHRPINDGDLEVLVLMQNAGLPEPATPSSPSRPMCGGVYVDSMPPDPEHFGMCVRLSTLDVRHAR